MALTPAQLAALRAAVFANAPSAALLAAGDAHGLRAALNATSSPAFTLWRTSITKDEIYANGFSWVAIDDVAEPKWRVWIELFDNAARAMQPSKPNVRAGIEEVWKGNQAKLAVQAYVLGKCKRTATVAEKMLATGIGSGAAPAIATFEGGISDLDAALLIFKDDGTIWTAQG